MKQTIKKSMAFFLAVFMVFGAAPLSGLAGLDLHLPEWMESPFSVDANAATYEDLKYTVVDGAAKITGCKSNASGELTIPEKLGGYPVKAIEKGAFQLCAYLTIIKFDENSQVTSIGESAFNQCDRLKSVEIPSGVKSIGDFAFYNCYHLESVILPAGITSIGYQVFHNAAVFSDSSNWDDGVFYIGEYLLEAEKSISGICTVKSGTRLIANLAFYGCKNLLGVEIPSSVLIIGAHAFFDCKYLVRLHIPSSVTTIGSNLLSSGSECVICSTDSSAYANTYAQEKGFSFEVCIGHGSTAIHSTGLTVSHTSQTLAVNATQQLTATVVPANATYKNIIWKSSSTDVATVSPAGLVTAISAGEATITAITDDGNKTATCVVTVAPPAVIKVEIQTLPNVITYTYKKEALRKAGLTIKVTYENGKTDFITDTYEINVTGFDSGKYGKQELTVEYSGIQAEEKITVQVKYTFLQWLIVIFLFGWIWY